MRDTYDTDESMGYPELVLTVRVQNACVVRNMDMETVVLASGTSPLSISQ